MNNLTTLYLMRHAQTDWNFQHLIQGHTDTLLNETGVQQAYKLKDELKDIKFDRVFSSDLIRAKRTAEIVTSERDLVIETTKLLREVNYSEFEGTSTREFFVKFDEWKTLSEKEKKKDENYERYSKVESWNEVSARLITFLREVAVGFKGQTILISTHGGLMHNLLIHLGYVEPKKLKRVHNTAYIKLESDGVDFFIKEVKGVEINA